MLFFDLLNHKLSLRYIYRILKLLNQRKLEAFKENWWNKNPNKKSCEEFEEDSGGGISIYNIGMGVISSHFIQYKTSLHVVLVVRLNSLIQERSLFFRWCVYRYFCWNWIGYTNTSFRICLLQRQETIKG